MPRKTHKTSKTGKDLCDFYRLPKATEQRRWICEYHFVSICSIRGKIIPYILYCYIYCNSSSKYLPLYFLHNWMFLHLHPTLTKTIHILGLNDMIQWGEQVFDTLPILQVFPLTQKSVIFIIGTSTVSDRI